VRDDDERSETQDELGTLVDRAPANPESGVGPQRVVRRRLDDFSHSSMRSRHEA
jgi:hypothetical protein